MKRTTTYGNKKNRKTKYIWISTIIAIVLIGVIIASVYQSNQVKQVPNETEENVQQNTENQEQVETPGQQTENAGTDETVENNEQPKEPITNSGYIEGQPLPSEPTFVEGVLIANKKYPLPSTFAPGESKEARTAFEQMAADARVAGFELVAFSTYRSFEYQESLYNNYVSRDGKENADRYSARPGYSEHQTGLAFDIGEKGKEDLWLTAEFGETEAGKWLVENSQKYGFILRFPQGKEAITGYMYESWHFRYLGVDLATKVKESNLTLEEYLGIE